MAQTLIQVKDLKKYYNGGDVKALDGVTVDICQYDLFCCAVAQARDPHLPPEQCDWFWWSRRRKTRNATGADGAED